jgi:hypothetical protein
MSRGTRPEHKPKRPRDTNQIAFAVIREATGEQPAEPPKPDSRNRAAVELSKLGASKGGKARASKLSAARRKAIARKAAKTRWSKSE